MMIKLALNPFLMSMAMMEMFHRAWAATYEQVS
jgi:hypothetical protein